MEVQGCLHAFERAYFALMRCEVKARKAPRVAKRTLRIPWSRASLGGKLREYAIAKCNSFFEYRTW